MTTFAFIFLLPAGLPSGAQELQRRPAAVAPSAGVRLGPGDQIALWVRDAVEINGRTYRIEEDGQVRIPLVGQVTAGGLTVAELEKVLLKRLETVLLEPELHLTVAELRNSPVTIVGSVKQPGTIQLRDRMTLLQALSTAGGIAPEAGNTVRITRRKQYGVIPLTTAKETEGGEFSTVEVDLAGILAGSSPASNLAIEPNDVINVLTAPIVYVMGEVKHSGGFTLSRKESEVSVLQALAMAEGMTQTAAPKKALILRPHPGSTREAISVDLKAILAGKSEDLRLMPDDILFIPDNRSAAKTVAMQIAQVAASMAVGISIVRAGGRR